MPQKSSLVLSLTYCLILMNVPAMAQWNLMGEQFVGGTGDLIGFWERLDISGDGNRIAFGTPNNSDNFPFSGYAKVFEWTGGEWAQLGESFDGVDPFQDEGTGSSVSLDGDGNTFALGISYSPNSSGARVGGVRIYDWDGSEWTQRGAEIEGEGHPDLPGATDVFGGSVNLSADGNTVIIGAEGNTFEPGILMLQGQVEVYDWDGQDWVQRGQDIMGLTGSEQFGRVVRISADGQRAAVASRSRWNAEFTSQVGAVTVFEWNSDANLWQEMGMPLMGAVNDASYGESISLDGDGTTLAITAKFGLTEVRDWNGAEWVLRGNLDQEEGLLEVSTVSLSADGDIVGIGDPRYNWSDGRVRVLEWNGNDWELIENIMVPEPDGSALQLFGLTLALSDNAGRVAVGSGFANRIEAFEREGFVGFDPQESTEVLVYPNPTSGILNIQGFEGSAKVELCTSLGEVLYACENCTSPFNVDLSRFDRGVYILHVRANVFESTQKIVLQH